MPADFEESDSPDKNVERMNGLKALFEQSSKLLSKLDERKSDSDEGSVIGYNALGEKMELQMITEEENEEKTFRTIKSNLTEEEVVMLIEEKNITIQSPENR